MFYNFYYTVGYQYQLFILSKLCNSLTTVIIKEYFIVRYNALYVQRSERTCCGRPCNFACGIFWRIFIRETAAAVSTLIVLLHEERITDSHGETRNSPGARTATLITYCTLANLGGYFAGALLGRLAEAICDRCKPLRPSKTQAPQTQHPT